MVMQDLQQVSQKDLEPAQDHIHPHFVFLMVCYEICHFILQICT